MKKEDKKQPKRTPSKHKMQCSICQHPLKEEIERDYLACMPFRHLAKVYGISVDTLHDHVYYFKLNEKRDRNKFYWRFIENVDLSKVSPSEALQAAIHLDKLEGKLREFAPPANVQIIYAHAEKIGLPETEQKSIDEHKDNTDRLLPSSDPNQVPSKPSQV